MGNPGDACSVHTSVIYLMGCLRYIERLFLKLHVASVIMLGFVLVCGHITHLATLRFASVRYTCEEDLQQECQRLCSDSYSPCWAYIAPSKSHARSQSYIEPCTHQDTFLSVGVPYHAMQRLRLDGSGGWRGGH